MTEEYKAKYKQIQSYYKGLTDVLKNTMLENKAIQLTQLFIEVLTKVRLKKVSNLNLTKELNTEIKRVLDLSRSQDLCMSLNSLSDYSKEYTDEEFQNDEDLNEIRQMSVEDLDAKIIENRTLQVYFSTFSPTDRASKYIVDKHKDILTLEEHLFKILKDVYPDDSDVEFYDIEILKEIFHTEAANKFAEKFAGDSSVDFVKKISTEETFRKECSTLLSNFEDIFFHIIDVDPVFKDNTLLVHLAYCGRLVVFYSHKALGCKLSEKEYHILQPYMNEILYILKDSYSNGRTLVLLENLKSLLDNDDLFDYAINSMLTCPELQWIVEKYSITSSLNGSNLTTEEEKRVEKNFQDRKLSEKDMRMLYSPVKEQQLEWLRKSQDYPTIKAFFANQKIYIANPADNKGPKGQYYIDSFWEYICLYAYKINDKTHFWAFFWMLYASNCFNWVEIAIAIKERKEMLCRHAISSATASNINVSKIQQRQEEFKKLMSDFIEIEEKSKSKRDKWKKKQEYCQIIFEEMFSRKLNSKMVTDGSAPSECERNCYDSFYGGITKDFIRQYGNFINEESYKDRKQHLIEGKITESRSQSINFKYQIKEDFDLSTLDGSDDTEDE